MGSWVSKLQGQDFSGAQGVWDAMPQWVRDRYLAKHPDSDMADGVMGGGGTSVQYNGIWFKSADSRDRYIMFVENASPSTAVEYQGKWFRSPESRDRYIFWIEGGGTGESPEQFAERGEMPPFEQWSPESQASFLAGQEYFSALGGWIALLESD